MLVLTAATKIELTVRKSRFVSEAIPVATAEAARELWHAQKLRYDNGGHIVHAFIVGPGANVMGCSDDGEPSGTAGRPTLEVVKGSGMTNLIVTTARWYGGIKLGTGGLVRAYTECAQLALAGAPVRALQHMAYVKFALPYPVYDPAKKLFTEMEFTTLREDFGGRIAVEGRLPEIYLDTFGARLRDFSKGEVAVVTTAVRLE